MKNHAMLLCGMLCLPAYAAATPLEFHQAVYALHERLIADKKIRTEEEKAAYDGAAARGYRYIETTYYDAETGQMISRVRRDAVRPEYIHIAEAYIYENGKLVRDFGSITLPWAPLHPVRTFINLHHYNGALHSWRQYNYVGDVSYESCKGEWNGKPVRLSLDNIDIDKATQAKPEYKACFDGMSTDWKTYIRPH